MEPHYLTLSVQVLEMGLNAFRNSKFSVVHAHTGSAKIIQGAMYCKGLAQINEEN